MVKLHTYINIISVVKESYLQELELFPLQPFKISGAAEQCKPQELQGSEQALAVSRADVNVSESS